MQNSNSKLKNSVFLLSTFYFLLSTLFANAQAAPQFLVSWQAQNYAPSWYAGKVFPTQGSLVEISFELVDSGKIVNLSSAKIRWYVNDKLVQNEYNGLGLKYLKIIIPDYPGQETEIRITIVDYKGQPLHKIIRIPVARPEAVIDAPYPGKSISLSGGLFEALPFFFNVKDLSGFLFDWTIDGKVPSEIGEKPQLLDLAINPGTPSGRQINISAMIKNISKELEFASKGLQLYVK